MFQTDLSSFYRNNLVNAYWGQIPVGVSQIPYVWNQIPGGASLLGNQIPYHTGFQGYPPAFTGTQGYSPACNVMCYPQTLSQFSNIPVGQTLIPTFGANVPFNTNQFLGQSLATPNFAGQGLTPFTTFGSLMNCR